jgi:hypothetical protein
MATQNHAAVVKQVACEQCLREIPVTEAVVPEATDYVAYFCGLECYQKWQSQRGKPEVEVPPAETTTKAS